MICVDVQKISSACYRKKLKIGDTLIGSLPKFTLHKVGLQPFLSDSGSLSTDLEINLSTDCNESRYQKVNFNNNKYLLFNCTMPQTSISTVPPTASRTFFTSSASSLLVFSFTFFGSSSTNFLA